MFSICGTFYWLNKVDRAETFAKSQLHLLRNHGFSRKNIAGPQTECRIEALK